ncbi:hypothetical protein [Catellatospora sichuanensis]|uniref:hypothetical protein n=1 Tax=Catellatospora sichuanensis TaxID=1969805 RepID=UPI001183DFA6|nr:hypothetical protein [Catellatospora sichuanensis]
MPEPTVRSRWQNAAMAAAMLAMGMAGALGCFIEISRIAPDSTLTALAAATAAAACATAGSTLAVRAVRSGVTAERDVLVIRGMLSTRHVPRADVIAVPVVEAPNGRGGTYFTPVIVYRADPKPPGRAARRELLTAVGVPAEAQTASVFLLRLASLSERGAQRHADRILVMATRAP